MLYLLGPEDRQSKENSHRTNLEDVVFNVFEDVTDSSTNALCGFFLKLSKKTNSGNKQDLNN